MTNFAKFHLIDFALVARLLGFEASHKRKGFFAIDLGFGRSWEGGLVVEAAEANDFSSWCLPHGGYRNV